MRALLHGLWHVLGSLAIGHFLAVRWWAWVKRRREAHQAKMRALEAAVRLSGRLRWVGTPRMVVWRWACGALLWEVLRAQCHLTYTIPAGLAGVVAECRFCGERFDGECVTCSDKRGPLE